MKSLEIAMNLIKQKNCYMEAIERLTKMDGYSDKDNTLHKCHAIVFESDYSTHMKWRASVDHEFNKLMVETALKYFKDRLSNLDTLLGLADMALERALTQPSNILEEQSPLDELARMSDDTPTPPSVGEEYAAELISDNGHVVPLTVQPLGKAKPRPRMVRALASEYDLEEGRTYEVSFEFDTMYEISIGPTTTICRDKTLFEEVKSDGN